jgi:formylglycine-generating enzyme required for sulfatase activity
MCATLKHGDKMAKLGPVLFIALISLYFSSAARAEKLPVAGSGQSFRDCPECPEMLVIPAGSFIMGGPPKPDYDSIDETLPQHKVTISRSFAVGKFAVKFEEWDACLSDGGCDGYKPDESGHGRGNRPVINVSWNDTKAYIAWLSKKTGKPYRLLSEAEWEYAARAGLMSKTFPAEFFEDLLLEDVVSGYRSPAKPNAWGLRNIYGRPGQWVEDCWNGNYKGAPRNGAAWTEGDCTVRVLRGGAGEEAILAAIRGSLPPETRETRYGFRVARPAGY